MDEETTEKVDTLAEYRDPKTGRWIKRPPGSFEITKENAAAMGRRRAEIYRRKAARWILEEAKAIDPRVRYTSDAWGMLLANLFTKIMDSEYPSAKDVYQLGQVLGALPKVGEVKIHNADDNPRVDDLAKAERILSIIERAKQLASTGEIVDVEPR